MIGKAFVAGLAAALALGAGPVRSQNAAAPPAIADFTAESVLSSPALSPSGRYLAFIRRAGDVRTLYVHDLRDGAVTAVMGSTANEDFGGQFIDWFRWKGEDRLIVRMTLLDIDRDGDRADGDVRNWRYGQGLFSVARDGSGFVEIKPPSTRDGRPGPVLDMLPDDPGHILMTYRENGLDVARIDVLTGEAEQVEDGDRRALSYITDRDGRIVGRTVRRGVLDRILVMEARGDDGRWTEVFRLKKDDIRELADYDFVGAAEEPGQVYVIVRPDDEAAESIAGVHVFDFRNRTLGPAIWRDDRYDAAGIVVDVETNAFLGGCVVADTFQCAFDDPEREAVMTALRRHFGEDAGVRIVSRSDDDGLWVLQVTAPHNPGVFYLYRADGKRLEPIGAAHAGLPDTGLGRAFRYEYRAQDGTALFGYLTRPANDTGATAPLIVMPHGGPEMRDQLTWDMWAQFLASRGYQVFQPNFRGSSGMGRDFAAAGYGEWGGRMQDDITAGVEQLVREGLADRSQVCILGASYGGYAALWGGATQGDLYRCVISIAGIGDLPALMAHTRREHGEDSDTYEYWLRSIGDPGRDRARLEGVSPVRRVEGWRAPTLLIHGAADELVPFDQSRDMERALRRAGVDVRLVELENEGHSGWSTRNDALVLTEIETFLARHLPVA
ncbi:S9 family peptidase, partial [Brevundimonas sp.]|uniref:alpha/beta hydrolase family protein n=1 Tax=Brevundimonas sp. TaxID=1871086 RepID=UPI002ED86659